SGYHDVRVVKTANGDEWTFPATEETVTALAFSGDGRLLATGSAYTENTIKLWDVQTRHFIGSLEGHTAWITCLRFLPDGKTIASSSGGDNTIRLWDVGMRQPLKFLRGKVARALSV